MPRAWQRLDLDGGGLQAANLRLARLLKRPRIARALLGLFALGAHRFYLDDRRGGLAYLAATLVTALGSAWDWRASAIGALALALRAAFDWRWIDRRVAEVNKRLRREVFFGQGATPPPGFRGRYADAADDRADDDSPQADRKRPPSFAEQERALREAARKRDDTAG